MTDETKKTIPRILVIEDDSDQRALLCDALQIHYGPASGGSVVGVASAQEALAMDLGQLDIVLQDYNLPDMPGLTLLRELLKRCDLPVIVVTGENHTQTAAEAISSGASDYVVKLGDYLFALPVLVDKSIRQHQMRRDNDRLQRQLQEMLQELQVKNVQLQEAVEQQRRMATTDHLTGLSNRRHFAEALERSFQEAVRYGFDVTCCMCDLDHYKTLNDMLGHQVGDRVLMATADVIRSSLRVSDLAARYGGDEFVLLLPHTSVDFGMSVGQRIRQELVSRMQNLIPADLPVTVSIGVSSLEADHPSCADHLLAMADRALYVAKDAGKDRIIAFGQCSLAR